MTKAELLDLLEPFADDTEILVLVDRREVYELIAAGEAFETMLDCSRGVYGERASFERSEIEKPTVVIGLDAGH